MSLEEEATMVMPRIPGGVTVPSGTYINFRTMAFTQCTSDTALPAMDWWHQVTNVSGSASTATVTSGVNTLLNAVGPIAGNYAFVAANLHSYTSADLPQSKGTGAQDA